MRKITSFLSLLLAFVALTAVGQTADPTASDAPSDGNWASNTTWYTINNLLNTYLSISYVDTNGYLYAANSTTEYVEDLSDNGLWCLVGDNTNGYTIYNKAAGTTKKMGLTGSGSSARVKMYTDEELTSNTSVTSLFTLTSSDKSTTDVPYAAIRGGASGTNYLNPQGGYLATWNSSGATNDNGSAFTFRVHTDEAILTTIKENIKTELDKWTTEGKVGYYINDNNEAYTTAKTVYDNASATKTECINAYNALVTAEASASIVLPQPGKYYQIVSSNATFNPEKYFYSDGDDVKWGNTNNADLNYYWTVVKTGEGDNSSLAIQSLATGKYIYLATGVSSTTNATMSTTIAPTTFSAKGKAGEVRIVVNGGTQALHLLGNVGGTGTSGNVVYWSGAYTDTGASAFYIREVDAKTVASNLSCAVTDDGLNTLQSSDAEKVTNYLRWYHYKTVAGTTFETNRANIGDDFFYYSPADGSNLNAETVKATMDKFTADCNALGSKTLENITAGLDDAYNLYTAALQDFTDGTKWTLNTPQAGDFLRIKAASGTACYLTNENATTQINSKTVGYFDSTADEANTAFYYDGSHLLNYSKGYYLENNAGFLYYNGVGANGTPTTDAAAITFTKQSATGQCNITFDNGGSQRTLHCSTTTTNCTANAGSGNQSTAGYTFYVERVGSLKVAITAAGYATFYAPVSVTIPSGVEAYTGTVEGDLLRLTAVSDQTIPAKTGVILKGAEGTYDFTIVKGSYDAYTADNQNEANKITGTTCSILSKTVTGASYDDTTASSEDNSSEESNTSDETADNGATKKLYTLQKRTDGVGLYPFADSATAELQGFKAYLPLDIETANTTAGVRGFIFDETATGITTAVSAPAADSHTIYDLSGRRINNATRGLYIMGGKKVFIR